MAIVINGSGTVTGLAVGGLPDGTVDAGTLATNSVDSAELIDGAVDNSHMAAMAASKLTGALPAIDGSALTGTGLGVGQTVQTVTRTLGTTYTNSTGKPIFVELRLYHTGATQFEVKINGISTQLSSNNVGWWCSASWIVPNGSTYLVPSTTYTQLSFTEIR